MPLFSRLFVQFQRRFPMGSLIAEFVTIHADQFVVRALAQQGSTILSTAMAAGATIEAAEDQAKLRALEALGLTALDGQHPSANLSASPDLTGVGAIAPDFLSDSAIDLATPPPLTAPLSPRPSVDHAWDSPLSAKPSSYPAAPPSTDTSPSSDALPEPEHIVADLYSHISSATSSNDDISDTIPDLPRASSLLHQPSMPQADLQPEKADGPDQPKPKPSGRKSTPPPAPAPPVTIDFSDILAQTDVEMRRLGWDARRGREYLKKTYSKRSRQELDEAELYDFLNYLKQQPSSSVSSG